MTQLQGNPGSWVIKPQRKATFISCGVTHWLQSTVQSGIIKVHRAHNMYGAVICFCCMLECSSMVGAWLECHGLVIATFLRHVLCECFFHFCGC